MRQRDGPRDRKAHIEAERWTERQSIVEPQREDKRCKVRQRDTERGRDAPSDTERCTVGQRDGMRDRGKHKRNVRSGGEVPSQVERCRVRQRGAD